MHKLCNIRFNPQYIRMGISAFLISLVVILIYLFAGPGSNVNIKVTPDLSMGSVGFRGVSDGEVWLSPSTIIVDSGDWIQDPEFGIMQATNKSTMVLRIPITMGTVNFVFNCSPNEGSCKVDIGKKLTVLNLAQGFTTDYGQPYPISLFSFSSIASRIVIAIVVALFMAVLFSVLLFSVKNEIYAKGNISAGNISEENISCIECRKWWHLFWNPTDKRWYLAFLYSFLVNFTAYGYVFANRFYSHDSLKLTTNKAELIWEVSLGRFLQYPLKLIRSDVSSTWLIGLVSCILLALSIYVLIQLFNVKSNISIFFITCLTTVNLSIICLNITYILSTDIFMLALFFNTLAAFFVEKYRFGFLAAAILIAASLAIYQAYITVTLVLLVSLLVKKCLHNIKLGDIFRAMAKYILSLLFGGILYFITLKLVLAIMNVNMTNGYNGLGGIQLSSYFYEFWELIVGSYKYIFKFLFLENGYYTNIMVVINLCIFVLTIVILMVFIQLNKPMFTHKILAVVLVLLLPLSASAIYFVSQGTVHILMMQGIFTMFSCIVILWDGFLQKFTSPFKKPINVIMLFLLVILSWNSIVYSNGAGVLKTTIINTTDMIMNRVVNRIEQLDGYLPGETKVYFSGTLEHSVLIRPSTEFKRFQDEYAVGLGYNTSITAGMENDYFTWQYIYNINILSQLPQENYQEVLDTMGAFPDKNSVVMIDECVIVKLS